MAKGETKLVAKVRFDDGSKKAHNGKATDYNVGEEYLGDAKQAMILRKKGLLCSSAELNASAEVIDEKDKTIKALEAKLVESAEALQAAEKTIASLNEDLAGLKAEPKK